MAEEILIRINLQSGEAKTKIDGVTKSTSKLAQEKKKLLELQKREAIEIANNTIYGLSGYVSAQNKDKAKEIANKLRTGMVHINYAPVDQNLPFGGYKMSGNGREWGAFGIEDFLENKAVIDSP